MNIMETYSTRAQLAAAPTACAAYLAEGERAGDFVWNSSNLAARVAADPLQGVYIGGVGDPTGAAGA